MKKSPMQGMAVVVRTRKPVLIHNTSEDERWWRRAWEDSESRVRSAMGVPLVDTDRVVGVLTLARPEPRAFTEADVAMVSEMAVAM